MKINITWTDAGRGLQDDTIENVSYIGSIGPFTCFHYFPPDNDGRLKVAMMLTHNIHRMGMEEEDSDRDDRLAGKVNNERMAAAKQLESDIYIAQVNEKARETGL
jgi:hypothetical protein